MAKLAMMQYDVASGTLARRQLVERLVVLATELTEERPARVESDADVVRGVFDHWRARLGHAAAKLTSERVRAIRARLKEGYSAADLKRAIDGCAASPFHIGENERAVRYDDLLLICRNGTKVEAFMRLAPEAVTTTIDDAMRALREESRAALREGRHEDYAAAQSRIRDALRAHRAADVGDRSEGQREA